MSASPALPDRAPDIGTGDAVAIAEDHYWLRMPLSQPLGFVNVWVLGDGEGWTIVDTGLGDAATEAAWRAALAGPLAHRPLVRVLITHAHPDHAGSAGWLTAEHGVPLWIPREEYAHCQALLGGSEDAAIAQACRSAGWDEALVESWQKRTAMVRGLFTPLPQSFVPVAAGDVVSAAGAWQVIGSNGHSPEHATLYNATRRTVITGDQVLPNLAANVGASDDAEGDPMGDWIDGLMRLRAAVPDQVLVLPSHGDPFSGLHARIDALLAIYRGKIERTRAALTGAKRAIDLLDATAGKPVKPHSMGMATFETLACLRRLEREGHAVVDADAAGVLWWRPA